MRFVKFVMGVYLKWLQPPAEASYTTVVIERATTRDGTYSSLITQAIGDTTYFDATGTVTNWYRIRFYDGTNYSEYSPPMRGSDTLGYVTIDEVRAMLKLQQAEYSDDDVQLFINKATKKVDEVTGRTWQGIREAKNELYDGNDTNIIYLNNTDVRSLDAIAIDDNNTGDFTTFSAGGFEVYEEGKIYLNPEKVEAESEYFVKGHNNVRISYRFGNQAPTESVKELCLLYIAQSIKGDEKKQRLIDILVESLRFHRPNLV